MAQCQIFNAAFAHHGMQCKGRRSALKTFTCHHRSPWGYLQKSHTMPHARGKGIRDQKGRRRRQQSTIGSRAQHTSTENQHRRNHGAQSGMFTVKHFNQNRTNIPHAAHATRCTSPGVGPGHRGTCLCGRFRQWWHIHAKPYGRPPHFPLLELCSAYGASPP